LFDVSGQFKVAALLIADQKKEAKKTPDQVKAAWATHKPAFDFLMTILQEEEKTEIKESFMEEQVDEGDRSFVLSVLGLE